MKFNLDNILKKQKNPHLHSPAHVLADELTVKFNDRKHFGFYLKTAIRLNHNYLRQLAGRVLEGKAKNPAALFAYLIKKENDQKNQQSA
jgi:hypothetical protein